MTKLSEYVEIASREYLQETGESALDARWVAAFFADCGVLDEYPRQDLVAFAGLVQKSLTRQCTAARQQRQLGVNKAIRFMQRQRKS